MKHIISPVTPARPVIRPVIRPVRTIPTRLRLTITILFGLALAALTGILS